LAIVAGVSTQPIRLWRTAGALAALEAALLVLYCIALAIAALNSSGAKLGAPFVEVLIYLIFAAGIGLVARGMFTGKFGARPPYLLTQVFVLIVAYTLFIGDGGVVKVIGLGIGLLGAIAMLFGVLTIIKQPAPEELIDEPRRSDDAA